VRANSSPCRLGRAAADGCARPAILSDVSKKREKMFGP
jgi:hypothetical protein